MEIMNIRDFDKVFEIMESSFPADEYRPKEKQRELLNKDYYKIYIQKDQCITGFITVYTFSDFVFAEHFAVSEKHRGKNIGTQMLNELKHIYCKPIILEVEKPENEISVRRIEFYKRNGFYLNLFDYIQPALGSDRKPVPLYIMSTNFPLAETEFERIKGEIYSKVYGR